MGDSSDAEDRDDRVAANPGYALGQIARALQTSSSHEDPEVRTRAVGRIEKWKKILAGMFQGTLKVGSRVPVKDAPAWATLEVARGGFATGSLLAGGELKAHEVEILARLGGAGGESERAVLNAHFLREDGFAELLAMLQSGHYRLEVPEEGALLAVAWLAGAQRVDDARAIVDEIAPFFDRLRFYPVPAATTFDDGDSVQLQTVGEVLRPLRDIRPPDQLVLQKRAIEVRRPLYERIVSLFCETVEGPLPTLRREAEGRRPIAPAIEGGWPCQHYPSGWTRRAAAVHAESLLKLPRSKGETCARSGFETLRSLLGVCAAEPSSLAAGQVGRIRQVLAGYITRHGGPDDSRWQELRQRQAQQIRRPLFADFARLLVARLHRASPDEASIAAVTEEESARTGLATGTEIPESLQKKVMRCIAAPVEVLVERGVLTSSETLATLVPELTAQAVASSLADSDQARLYRSLYTAFRRRRSLLLLNLQSQVRFEELPWVKAITPSTAPGEQAKRTLERIVVLAIRSFPQEILPNKLLQEIRSLAKAAGATTPIVDELAADIFMGAFAGKFLAAAKIAARLLKGTLYERYYGLDYAAVEAMPEGRTLVYGTQTSPEFLQLCKRLAGEEGPTAWNAARNGKIIEQSQVLTTHNLAPLFIELGLAESLRDELADLAIRCFVWICRQQRQNANPWSARLRMVKNCAYAWRQMVFFLSVSPAGALEPFITRAREVLAREGGDVQHRLRPVLEGLQSPLDRTVHEANGESPRRLLGWTTGKHWLLQS